MLLLLYISRALFSLLCLYPSNPLPFSRAFPLCYGCCCCWCFFFVLISALSYWCTLYRHTDRMHGASYTHTHTQSHLLSSRCFSYLVGSFDVSTLTSRSFAPFSPVVVLTRCCADYSNCMWTAASVSYLKQTRRYALFFFVLTSLFRISWFIFICNIM